MAEYIKSEEVKSHRRRTKRKARGYKVNEARSQGLRQIKVGIHNGCNHDKPAFLKCLFTSVGKLHITPRVFLLAGAFIGRLVLMFVLRLWKKKYVGHGFKNQIIGRFDSCLPGNAHR